jgi:UDP-N-acetylmuramoylalanine--D-glutamate ligase
MLDGAALLGRAELQLLGDHNVGNALAAVLAARAAGVEPAALARGLAGFRARAHRLEPIGEVEGVLWINDSKATNVASVAVAVRAMSRPFVLIAGGRHKGEPYVSLVPSLGSRCRAVVAYGEAAPLIQRDLSPGATVQVVNLFADAVGLARRLSRPGDAVLMSPACSSFDQFTSYEERGETLRRLVEAM